MHEVRVRAPVSLSCVQLISRSEMATLLTHHRCLWMVSNKAYKAVEKPRVAFGTAKDMEIREVQGVPLSFASQRLLWCMERKT